MKILYFTDTHDMGRNPGSRVDDYHSAIFAKMNEAINAAIAIKVDAIVHGGDWFNHPKVSNIIYNQHQRMLQKARAAGIPVYCVPGNHDLFGYSMSTIDQTSIGSLADAKLITLLTRDTPVLLTGKSGITVALYGREYSVDIDHNPTTDYQINMLKSKNNQPIQEHLLFSHGMLLDKPFHPDVRHTLTKDVITDADYVFNGHYHPGWKTHVLGNTTFINNGSTGRNEGSVGNLTFVPQYTLFETDGVTTQITAVPYMCAAKGVDIFDRTQLVQTKQHIQHLEAFEQTMQDALAYDAFNPKDIILNTKPTKQLPQEVLDEALSAIVAQEQLAQDSKLDNYVASKSPVHIEWMEIINFEAHRHTKIDFDGHGLNAITGPSDSGKSAIIRALRFAFYNEPKGADFIRHGAKRATVQVRMSNGQTIERTRTRSSAGEYILTDSHGQWEEFKGFGNSIPIQIANAHQMPKVELATGVERPLNFAFQLDGHFLLSDSPASRASAIGRLTGVHLVDAAIKEKTKEMRAITIEANAAEELIESLTTKLESYKWINSEEKHLRIIEGLVIGAEKDEQEIELLTGLLEQRTELRADINEYKASLAELDYLDDAEIRLTEASELNEELLYLKGLHDTSVATTKEIDKLSKSLDQYDLNRIEVFLIDADLVNNEISMLVALETDADFIHKDIAFNESKLLKVDMPLIESRIKSLESDEQELMNMIALLEECEFVKCELDRLEAKQAKQTISLERIESEMDALIDSLGDSCPLCNQAITDKELIKHSH